MAKFAGLPKPPSYPSGRYTRTNPLRREGGLRLLTAYLPEPLRWAIVRAWRRPSRFPPDNAPLDLQSTQRRRLNDAGLAKFAPRTICWFSLTELEIARRIVEVPQVSIRPATRNSLLIAQSAYLCQLYTALAWQIGEAAALAEFQHLVAAVD